MTITVQIEKHPLTHFQPSKYCEWCVTITTDDPNGFTNSDGDSVPLQWALDFPADTDILDPDQAKKIKGAPPYTLDPEPGKGTISRPGQREVKICFVAACREREGTEMSLENRTDFPPGAMMAPREWHRVPYDGGPNGLGRVVGPAPVAMTAPSSSDEFAFLASFEARKLRSLMGIASGPVHGDLPSLARLPASRAERIYVSGASASRPKQVRARRRR